MYTLRFKKGFTLLFAVFASALLLSIGISIFTIARKELILSSAGRESQFAFAAADSGAECALYWDFVHHAFTPQEPDETYTTEIACGTEIDGGSTKTVVTPTDFGDPDGQTSFSVLFSNGSCTNVTITKHSSITLPGCASRCTLVFSEGFNTCKTDDPLRLQRTLRVNY